jgi:protein N-terminal methyltransferase
LVTLILRADRSIGRVTEGLLLDVADEVDVIEPVTKFTDALRGKPGIRHVFSMGLEEWQPAENTRYGLIWTQWCVGHLTDAQLVSYLERCKDAIDTNGVIVLKENLSTADGDLFDEDDSSVTR